MTLEDITRVPENENDISLANDNDRSFSTTRVLSTPALVSLCYIRLLVVLHDLQVIAGVEPA
jgi:hypothetical protein